MIALNSTNLEVFGLTYWKLKPGDSETVYTLNRDEKELLRKVLLAKNIQLVDEILEVKEDEIAVLTISNMQLVFDSVDIPDSSQIIHLSKLSSMLKDAEQKKKTWYKLRKLSL